MIVRIYCRQNDQIRVHQYALRSTEGLCTEDAELPSHMALPVPFTKEIEIGQLKDGNYEFEYKKGSSSEGRRGIYVEKATVATVDNFHYASMSSVFANDVYNGSDPIKLEIGGSITSTCSELDTVEVKKVDDVFIVLPKLRYKSGMMCTQVLVPFARTLELGKLAPGNYLAHIRSMNGKALNKYFTVAK